MNHLRMLILVDWCPDEGDFVYLQSIFRKVDIFGAPIVKGATHGLKKFFYRWTGYMRIVLRAYRKSANYDLIVAYQPVCGILLSFLFRMHHIKPAYLLVANFIYTEKRNRFYMTLRKSFTNFCLKYIDWITVYTRKEVITVSNLLSYPKEKITCIQQGVFIREADGFMGAEQKLKNYVFSSGMSMRDYRTLIEAFCHIDYKLVIVCQEHNIRNINIPKNVQVHIDIWGEQVNKLRNEARIVVVPLLDDNISAGQYDILFAMAAGKAIIATKTVASIEHIIHNLNGFLVQKQNVRELREKILYLLNNPKEARRLGKSAYRKFINEFTFDIYQKRLAQLIIEKIS